MSPLALDTRTLAMVEVMVTAVLSFAMLFTWRTRKTYPGFGLWTAGNGTLAAGFLLLFLRDLIPDLISILGANVLLLSGSLLFFEGLRRFRGLSGRKIFSVSLIVLVMVCQLYFTYVKNSLATRIIILSTLLAVVFARSAIELFRNVPLEMRPTYWVTGSSFAAQSMIMISRAFITYFDPDRQDIFAPDWLLALTLTAAIFFSIAWTFSFVTLNSERLELDLKTAQVELRRLATTDFLTGIPNDRHFFETAGRELQRALRYDRPLAVLMLDIDHFKQVNDTHGHAVGDRVLVAVAATCQKHLRDVDALGRLGGEEFAILLLETDHTGGNAAAERLRLAIAETDIEANAVTLRVTVSIGVSARLPDDKRIETVLNRADLALYEAKRNGRNRVVAA